jgi:putative ABC transport system substrate-binding protein
MKRRTLLASSALASIAGGTSALAQPAMPRIGFLIAGDPEPSWSHFRKAMADLGYVEGRTVHYEYRAKRTGLDEHAAALVSLPVNVIVAILTPAITAARKATSTIPIVFNGSAPTAGLVTNIARPEGNLTGLFGPGAMLYAKNIQLLREIKPQAKTIAMLLNESDPFHLVMRRDIESIGRELQVTILPVGVKSRIELPAAFKAMREQNVDGVIVQPSLPMAETGALAVEHRIPAVSARREFAEAGGLFSYGSAQLQLHREVAGYVDRILKGASPADLPVRLPTHFELIVNQKAAKAMGLALSPMFLGRADEVIE